MAGRATDGESVWEGPQWASPDRAERLVSRPVYGRRDPIWGVLCWSLQKGQISPAGFRVAAHIRMTWEQQQAYLKELEDEDCS